MSQMIIARKPCGCITMAVLDIKYLTIEDIIQPLKDGDIISLEEHELIGIERCLRHTIGCWLLKQKYKLLHNLEESK